MIWVAVAALLAAGAVVPVVGGWRPGRDRGPRARARSAHALLGHALATGPVPREPERVRAAQERWTTCGGVLAEARTSAQYRLAQRLAQEGLELLRER